MACDTETQRCPRGASWDSALTALSDGWKGWALLFTAFSSEICHVKLLVRHQQMLMVPWPPEPPGSGAGPLPGAAPPLHSRVKGLSRFLPLRPWQGGAGGAQSPDQKPASWGEGTPAVAVGVSGFGSALRPVTQLPPLPEPRWFSLSDADSLVPRAAERTCPLNVCLTGRICCPFFLTEGGGLSSGLRQPWV